MKTLTMGEAARVWGIPKSTISEHRKAGKLSADKDGGSYRIQPAEMERVYGAPKKKAVQDRPDDIKPYRFGPNTEDHFKNKELELKFNFLEEKLKKEAAEREADKQTAQAEIDRLNKLLTKALDVPLLLEDKRKELDASNERVQSDSQNTLTWRWPWDKRRSG